MSDHRNDLSDERAPDNVPRARKAHLARWWEHWSGSRRGPQLPDEAGAVAVIEAWDGKRIAFYPDGPDTYRVRELDRGTGR